MFRPLSLLSLFLCWSVAVGFAPASSMTKPTSLSFLQMSEQAPDQQDDPNASNNIELALKMVGVLAIKTVKDVVNYPPMMLDQALRDAQHNNTTKLPQTSPLVMLVKLMGVLLFKTVHDALYYPALWTERMIECQSLEECELK